MPGRQITRVIDEPTAAEVVKVEFNVPEKRATLTLLLRNPARTIVEGRSVAVVVSDSDLTTLNSILTNLAVQAANQLGF